MNEHHSRGRLLLDVAGAAEYLNVGERFIRRLVVAERCIPFHRVGRHLRFDTVDLDAFVEAGRVDSGGGAA